MIEKTLRKNNLTIALNVCMLKKKKIYPSYASKHNSGRGKQVILLMATNWKGRNYPAVKRLTLLVWITL